MDYEQRLERVDDVAEQVLSADAYQEFKQVREGLQQDEVGSERAAEAMNTLELELVREMDAAKGKADSAYTERDEAEKEETVVAPQDDFHHRRSGDLDEGNEEADEHAKEAAETYETFQELRGDYQMLMSVDEDLKERMGDEYESKRFDDGVEQLRQERGELRPGEADAYDTRLEKKDLRAKES